ncbi:helix-turn-helix domain-containing protein [Pseudomonas kurunegalensis]|uniref:helix-turn-helix domain-containing protein n=1 Tax=Pseudomonas kurunegalensis TaxID=485880 RepID=UPI002570BDB2|nr:helix-turn-helix domain-containing protein [Pseudomonas kurunegalensis]WJD60698.1 helix-turn-helix domain-containing protein [Pseudomonas kurunegalensis]
MATTFSTNGIDDHHRLAYWHEVICKTYLTVKCRPQADEPLQGALSVLHLGSIELSESLSPPMIYERGASEISRDDDDHFQFCLWNTGSGIVQQGGREIILRPGDLALYSAASPSIVNCPTGSNTLLLKIPKAALSTRTQCLQSHNLHTLRGDTAAGAMVGQMMRQTWLIQEENPLLGDPRLGSALLDMIGASLDAASGILPAGQRHNPLAQIKSYIQNNLGDPELDMEEVAKKHSVSIRTLHRLFASEGTSAKRWLWLQRLAASHKALSDGRMRQVSEAALTYGFNDLSHFSRLFKQVYGISPSELLRH